MISRQLDDAVSARLRQERRAAMLDPDPVTKLLAEETAADHALAKHRGQCVREMANAIISALDGHGIILDQQRARVIINAVLADVLYGNASVDIDPRP